MGELYYALFKAIRAPMKRWWRRVGIWWVGLILIPQTLLYVNLAVDYFRIVNDLPAWYNRYPGLFRHVLVPLHYFLEIIWLPLIFVLWFSAVLAARSYASSLVVEAKPTVDNEEIRLALFHVLLVQGVWPVILLSLYYHYWDLLFDSPIGHLQRRLNWSEWNSLNWSEWYSIVLNIILSPYSVVVMLVFLVYCLSEQLNRITVSLAFLACACFLSRDFQWISYSWLNITLRDYNLNNPVWTVVLQGAGLIFTIVGLLLLFGQFKRIGVVLLSMLFILTIEANLHIDIGNNWINLWFNYMENIRIQLFPVYLNFDLMSSELTLVVLGIRWNFETGVWAVFLELPFRAISFIAIYYLMLLVIAPKSQFRLIRHRLGLAG